MKKTFSDIRRAVFSAPDWHSAVSGHSLGIFRIVFGLLMTWEMIYFIRIDFVSVFLDLPMIQFTYPGFEWLQPLAPDILEGLVILLLACAVFITIGLLFRWAMLIFFLGFTYLFLLDQAYYNNHLYLLSLLSFWMIFLPMDATLSIQKKESRLVPAGSLAILRFHIVLVYFFGGISKINPDWLFRQEPVRTLIDNTPVLSNLPGEEFIVYLLIYGGLIFDLVAGFLLLYKPTRAIGLITAIAFNGSNAIIFNDINIFPFFMLGSLVLFLEPQTVAGWFEKKKKTPNKKKKSSAREAQSSQNHLADGILGDGKFLRGLFVAYMVFHCLWPFRHLIIPGHVDWTGQGQRFAWRMKIQTRNTELMEFSVLDYQTKTIYPVSLDDYRFNYDQQRSIGLQPGLLMQTIQFLKQRGIQRLGHEDVGVRARIKVSYNGRPAQWVVDQEADLSSETYRIWGHNEWILPLENP